MPFKWLFRSVEPVDSVLPLSGNSCEMLHACVAHVFTTGMHGAYDDPVTHGWVSRRIHGVAGFYRAVDHCGGQHARWTGRMFAAVGLDWSPFAAFFFPSRQFGPLSPAC